MDLHDFDQTTLYFDEPVDPQVSRLLAQAGQDYGRAQAEAALHAAYFLAPESLLVLVALYRYYFYQHRLETALMVAERALTLTARRLELPLDWHRLHTEHLGYAALKSMGLLRFYLHTLKAAGYLELRLGRIEAGRQRIEKLVELDSRDRMGGRVLLRWITDAVAQRIEAAV